MANVSKVSASENISSISYIKTLLMPPLPTPQPQAHLFIIFFASHTHHTHTHVHTHTVLERPQVLGGWQMYQARHFYILPVRQCVPGCIHVLQMGCPADKVPR